MAEITAALVKELRDKTGAGMMDCKRALDESKGDIEAAVDWLRKKGLAAAAKKAGRVAAEGLVGVATAAKAGAVVEVNSETDFVARNELFQAFVRTVAALAVAHDRDVETLKAASFAGNGKTVEDELTDLIARVGENMVLRRVKRLTVGQGHVASYVHNAVAPGLGKIGVLVALELAASEEVLAPLGRQLAMHVAAANPQYLDLASVPASALDRERAVLREQALESGKAEDIVDRMVEGPAAQILRGFGAARSGLCDRWRDPGRQGRRGGGQGCGDADQDRRLCPLCPRRGDRTGRPPISPPRSRHSSH